MFEELKVSKYHDGPVKSSDESIVLTTLAEGAVVQGNGRMIAIKIVRFKVAHKSGEDPQSCSFSRSWTCPRSVMNLATGQLALGNVTFLVANADLACKPLIIGLPVLKHLQVDTPTPLDNNRAVLDGANCSHIGNTTTGDRGSIVSRMVTARLDRIRTAEDDADTGTEPQTNRPRVKYQTARTEEDRFRDPSLLDSIDSEQHTDRRTCVANMKNSAVDSGLPIEYRKTMSDLVNGHIGVLRTRFSFGPPAKLPRLKVELMPDDDSAKVQLRNYSMDQHEFFKRFVAILVRNGMAYANPTSPLTCAPLLLPKTGPEVQYRFTVDPRPINKFTMKHQFPMPNLEHKLTRLSDSRYYATFDLSDCYWQLELDATSQALQSFITSDGLYSPSRVMHGTTKTVKHLQAALSEIPLTGLTSHILHWLYDIILLDRTVSGLVKSIRELLYLCVCKNIKLHPKKIILFATSLRWRGQLMSAYVIRYDPRRLDGLLQMEPLTTTAHLQQFFCVL